MSCISPSTPVHMTVGLGGSSAESIQHDVEGTIRYILGPSISYPYTHLILIVDTAPEIVHWSDAVVTKMISTLIISF